MSILCRGTWSHLMIDDLVRFFFVFMRVGSVCLSKGDSFFFTMGDSTFLCIGIFVSSFSRHRSTVNKRKMLMGYNSDQTDEPSVHLVLIIATILSFFFILFIPGSSSSSSTVIGGGKISSSSEIFLGCELLSHSSSS